MIAHTSELSLLVSFFKTGTRCSFEKGDYIIGPSQTAHTISYIETGVIKAYSLTKDGDENLLIIRHSGELLGISYAVSQKDREIMYKALTPAQTWSVPYEKFKRFLQKNPAAGLPILDIVTNMYLLHCERIMTLGYRTVRERLASFLLSMIERFGEVDSNSAAITIPLIQSDIASAICSARETVGRVLAELERRGVIMLDSSVITIKDVGYLRRLTS